MQGELLKAILLDDAPKHRNKESQIKDKRIHRDMIRLKIQWGRGDRRDSPIMRKQEVVGASEALETARWRGSTSF